ncbi:hypothetical protein AAVH_14000 [Aphelenchoides avenae]|nr:hypothetical protein AAVH_14000 [Aphelenchus avenae]
MTPSTLAIFVVVPLLSFSFTYDISFFSATLPSQLPVLATLLLVSQRCSMQGTPSSSRMLHSLHRPTSVVIALATATHRVAHAAYEKVTAESIANTRYNGTAVSINGSDIVIYLKNDGSSNVYFAFNGDYQFRLEKCPSEPAEISVEDHSCKWGVDWNDDYCIVQPNHSLWSIQFPEPKRRKIQNLMFRYDMDDERIVCEDRPGHSLEAKNVQELCMWTSALQGHNVSAITITNENPSCPVRVIFVNAMLFATMPDATTLMGFVSDGMLNAEPESTTPSSGDEGGLTTLEIVWVS